MQVFLVKNEQQQTDAFSVRVEVFVKEQNVPAEIEVDQYDEQCSHFVLYDQDIPIGAGRLRELDGYGKIERVCIKSDYRQKGLGKLLMDEIETIGKDLGFTRFKLHSQTQALGFYEGLGYEVCSNEFYDAGIPHVIMKKTL